MHVNINSTNINGNVEGDNIMCDCSKRYHVGDVVVDRQYNSFTRVGVITCVEEKYSYAVMIKLGKKFTFESLDTEYIIHNENEPEVRVVQEVPQPDGEPSPETLTEVFGTE